jgi:hypothetical protein
MIWCRCCASTSGHRDGSSDLTPFRRTSDESRRRTRSGERGAKYDEVVQFWRGQDGTKVRSLPVDPQFGSRAFAIVISTPTLRAARRIRVNWSLLPSTRTTQRRQRSGSRRTASVNASSMTRWGGARRSPIPSKPKLHPSRDPAVTTKACVEAESRFVPPDPWLHLMVWQPHGSGSHTASILSIPCVRFRAPLDRNDLRGPLAPRPAAVRQPWR